MTTASEAPAATMAVPTRGLGGEQRSLTIGLLLIVTLVAFEALAVATVMPLARDELGGIRLYGWTFSAFLLASLIGIVWAGEQCDKRGPAAPFLAGLGFFSLGLVIAGLAPAMWVLVAGRAVQGLGAGVLPAVAWVGIGRGYDEASRPRMLAFMSSAWVVPGLTGPGIAAVLAETLSWRLVFLGLLPLVLVAAVLTLPGLRRLGAPAERNGAPSRLLPAMQLTAGTAIFLGGLSSPAWLLGVPLCVIGFAIALPALYRLLPKGTLKLLRGLPSTMGGHGLLNFAFFGGDAYVPFALITLRGESTLVVGALLSIPAITWTAGTWALERTAGRIDRRWGMTLGLVLVAVELSTMAVSLLPGVPIVVPALAWAVGALGMGLAYPSFALAIINEAETGQEGAVTSSMKLVESLGNALGAGVGGALIAAGAVLGSETGGTAAAFLWAAGLALVALIPAWRSNAT